MGLADVLVTLSALPHEFSAFALCIVSLHHFHGQEKNRYTSHERGEQWKKENESLRLSSNEKRSGWWKAEENPWPR